MFKNNEPPNNNKTKFRVMKIDLHLLPPNETLYCFDVLTWTVQSCNKVLDNIYNYSVYMHHCINSKTYHNGQESLPAPPPGSTVLYPS